MLTADQKRRNAGVTAGDFKSTMQPRHRCKFNEAGRCRCGNHRAPAFGTGGSAFAALTVLI